MLSLLLGARSSAQEATAIKGSSEASAAHAQSVKAKEQWFTSLTELTAVTRAPWTTPVRGHRHQHSAERSRGVQIGTKVSLVPWTISVGAVISLSAAWTGSQNTSLNMARPCLSVGVNWM